MQHAKQFAHPERIITHLGIEPGMTVADFGAGSGAYALAMAKALHGSGKLYAIDVQKDLLRRIVNEASQRRISGVEVIWADLELAHASKLADHSVDLVLISNLLFQLVDKMPPLHEAHRILKRHGRLVLIDWSESFRHMGPAPEDVVRKEEALGYAARAHFVPHAEFSAGAHHYGLILKPQRT